MIAAMDLSSLEGRMELRTDRPPLDYPAARDLATDASLIPSARSVYNHLATTHGFVRFQLVKVAKVARCLGADEDTISRGLKVLVEHGYVERGPFGTGFRSARAYRLVWQREAKQ